MRTLRLMSGWVAAGLLSLGMVASAQIQIHRLEANAPNSAFLGMTVITTGIVVDVVPHGFYLEAKQSDWNSPLSPTASEGIFVFTSLNPPPSQAVVGNELEVVGTVALSQAAGGALTQATWIINPLNISVLTTNNPLPPAIVLTPADTPPSGGFTPMLRYQGMRVTAAEFDTVGPTGGTINQSTQTPTSNGIFYGVVHGVYANQGPAYREAGVSVTEPTLPAGIATWDGNPEVLIFDSKSTGGQVLDTAANAQYTTLTGVVDFQAGQATVVLDPTTYNVSFADSNGQTTEAATETGIGTLNVENFYSDLPSPNGNTASVTITSAAYRARLQKLSAYVRNEMFSPEILALQEVSTPAGNPNQTLLDIANQINTDAANTPGQMNPGYVIGVIGTGNAATGLANAILYNPSKITVSAGSGEIGSTTLFDDLPLRLFASIKQTNNGATYPITVLNCELLARTNEDNTSTTGAAVRLQREQQAEYLAREISDEEQSNIHIIAVGDFNAFQFSDGYTDLVNVVKGTPPAANAVVQGTTPNYVQPNPALVELTLPSFTNYSYVENGAAELVDHMLMSPGLAATSRLTHTIGNTDLPVAYYGNALLYGSSRASDHDGLVAYLTPQTILATPTGTVVASPEPSLYGSSFTLKATVTPPAGATATPGGTVTFSIDGTQLGAPVTMSGGTATSISTTILYSVGTHALSAVYSGDTNYSTITMTGSHVISLDPTTSDVNTDVPVGGITPTPDMTPKTVFYGQDFNVVGSVVPTGPGPLTGNYLFFDNYGGTNSLICTLPTTVPQCTTVNDNFDAGVHSLTVGYSGDATNAASTSAPVTLTIDPDTTTTTVASSTNPAFQGQPVTFTATVTGNFAPPVGTVAFNDGVLLGTATLVPSTTGNTSTATFTTSTLAANTYSITASYTPATIAPNSTVTDFLASATGPPALIQTILPPIALPSTITLASSLNPAGFGQTVSFTATITVNPPPGNTNPLPTVPATGTVTFFDGGTQLSASAVDPTTGIATFNISTLAVGSHVITAQYSGDVYYLPGSSLPLTEVIHVPYTGPADFSLTIAQNPIINGVGLSNTTTVTLAATNGWTNDVTLACPGNLPEETTCSFGQTTIDFTTNNVQTSTLTIMTHAPRNCGSNTPYFTGTGTAQLEMRFGSAALAGLLICLLPRRRRVLRGLLLAMLCVLPCVAGCGNCTDLGTRPGTYTFPITGSGVGTTTTHTVNLQLQVNL